MSNVTLLIGLGIVLFSLLYMFFKLGANKAEGETGHFILQIIILVFMFMIMLMIGKVGLDDYQHCSIEVNETDTYDGAPPLENHSYSVYTYDRVCFDNENTTANTFYKSITYFIIIVAFYTLVYILWTASEYFREAVRKRLGRK